MKIFFGNWKMTLQDDAAVALAAEVAEAAGDYSGLEIAVAPSFTALTAVAEAIHGSGVDLGAQDSFWEEKGAWTGEVSPVNLKALGCVTSSWATPNVGRSARPTRSWPRKSRRP